MLNILLVELLNSSKKETFCCPFSKEDEIMFKHLTTLILYAFGSKLNQMPSRSDYKQIVLH